MTDELCKERHRQVDERYDRHELRLNAHSEELDRIRLETADIRKENAEFRVMIQNLCKDLQALNDTLKWFLGLSATAMVGFFMYAAQVGLLGR